MLSQELIFKPHGTRGDWQGSYVEFPNHIFYGRTQEEVRKHAEEAKAEGRLCHIVWVESSERCEVHNCQMIMFMDKPVCADCECEAQQELASEAAWEERAWR